MRITHIVAKCQREHALEISQCLSPPSGENLICNHRAHVRQIIKNEAVRYYKKNNIVSWNFVSAMSHFTFVIQYFRFTVVLLCFKLFIIY